MAGRHTATPLQCHSAPFLGRAGGVCQCNHYRFSARDRQDHPQAAPPNGDHRLRQWFGEASGCRQSCGNLAGCPARSMPAQRHFCAGEPGERIVSWLIPSAARSEAGGEPVRITCGRVRRDHQTSSPSRGTQGRAATRQLPVADGLIGRRRSGRCIPGDQPGEQGHVTVALATCSAPGAVRRWGCATINLALPSRLPRNSITTSTTKPRRGQ